jgi:hypothetical protein
MEVKGIGCEFPLREGLTSGDRPYMLILTYTHYHEGC